MTDTRNAPEDNDIEDKNIFAAANQDSSEGQPTIGEENSDEEGDDDSEDDDEEEGDEDGDEDDEEEAPAQL